MHFSSSEMEGLIACYAECSKSEREKQISYISADIGSLENWYWWTYFPGGNRDTGIETDLNMVGEGEGGTNWESVIETYMLQYVK